MWFEEQRLALAMVEEMNALLFEIFVCKYTPSGEWIEQKLSAVIFIVQDSIFWCKG